MKIKLINSIPAPHGPRQSCCSLLALIMLAMFSLACLSTSAVVQSAPSAVPSSTIGYSRLDMDNTNGQTPSAFKTGQYALFNLLYYPAPSVMIGGELQWGKRANNSDGWTSDDFRTQFSFKYNFSRTFGG